MDDAELRAAIERPARAQGLTLEAGLVDVLVGELAGDLTGASGYQPGALPMLAHALRATWQQRDGTTLTVAGYRLVGGIKGSVARTAEHAYQQLNASRQEIARGALLRMVRLGDGTGDARSQVEQANLVKESTDPESAEAVLDALIQARLLTTDGTTVEIIHEALLGAWPRLREWIDGDRAGLILQQRLVASAETWDHDGRQDADLYRGPRLVAVRERVEKARPSLPAVAAEFLAASDARERAEDEAAARRGRALRRQVTLLSCLLVLAVASTAVAFYQQVDLRREADVGVSRQLAGLAVVLSGSDRAAGAQLAVAAYRIAPTAQARGALLTGLVAIEPDQRSNTDTGGAVRDVAFSPGDDLLAAADESGVVRVWAGGAAASLADIPITELKLSKQARAVEFDPLGRFLAVNSRDRTTRLYAVAGLTGLAPSPLATLPANDQPLAFSRDAAVLATGGESRNSVRLWDLTGPRPEKQGQLVGQRFQIFAVAFDGGRTLATASLDGTVWLWDVADLRSPRHIGTIDAADAGYVYAVAFRPDGRVLASGHQDDSARLWNVQDRTDPKPVSTLTGPPVGRGGRGVLPRWAEAGHGQHRQHRRAMGRVDAVRAGAVG